jgi:hypothetical protein
MAITDAYASAAEYRTRTEKSDTGDDATVLLDLKAISRVIDRKLGRQRTGFNVDASDVKRIFRPDPLQADPRILPIPPLSATPTSVTIDTDGDGLFTDETALNITQITGDVMLEPRDTLDGPEPAPFTELHMTPWGAYPGGWPAGLMVEVDGRWGWPAVPEAIKVAAIQLTAIYRLETPRATSQISDIGTIIGMSTSAQTIIEDLYRTYRSQAVLF